MLGTREGEGEEGEKDCNGLAFDSVGGHKYSKYSNTIEIGISSRDTGHNKVCV